MGPRGARRHRSTGTAIPRRTAQDPPSVTPAYRRPDDAPKRPEADPRNNRSESGGGVTATKIRPTYCANGCGRTIPQPAKGRPRKTCSDRCRQQLKRRRNALPWPPAAPPDYPTDPETVRRRTVEALVAVLNGEPPAPAEDQLAQGILEIDWLAYNIARLEPDLPARLGARAADLAHRLRAARRAVFPDVDGGPE